jgi:hypothetical protein
MATSDGKNLNPIIKQIVDDQYFEANRLRMELDWQVDDEIDSHEVYDMIRHINDPEHPNTLEELQVVYPSGVTMDGNTIRV